MTTKFQIPLTDVMPSEEMIDWLDAMDQEWSGDPGGIDIYTPDGETVMHGDPGDWLVEIDGVYMISKTEPVI